MSNNLKKHKEFLLLLQKSCKNQREALLKTATASQLKALSECTLNVCAGNVQLTPRQFTSLRKHKKQLYQFLQSKTLEKRRHSVQTGGFISILLTTLLPIIASLTEKVLTNAIK